MYQNGYEKISLCDTLILTTSQVRWYIYGGWKGHLPNIHTNPRVGYVVTFNKLLAA